ncbi:hypothetical protein AK830_g4816 [Neonectria ditissima]|uniref:Uncharacterized protein n=1 Tax=Neonectria ditissima TaxID=78410 RepID=A0A0P7BM58_9HYPO|nr:hypothetical protein AK830_g4816 [Neonectria ditissima]
MSFLSGPDMLRNEWAGILQADSRRFTTAGDFDESINVYCARLGDRVRHSPQLKSSRLDSDQYPLQLDIRCYQIMKTSNNALLLLAYSVLVSSAVSPASPEARAKAICGDLGILDITTLPDGVEPSELRLCADHPMGRNRTLDPKKGASLAPGGEGYRKDITPADSTDVLSKRVCYDAAPYGCEGKWCWKTCGDNEEWCWTAWARGGLELGDGVRAGGIVARTTPTLAVGRTVRLQGSAVAVASCF